MNQPLPRVRSAKSPIAICSGAIWAQRQSWRNITHLLPANACLLVVDTQNERQTQIMRQVARSFHDTGRQVLIWMAPKTKQSAISGQNTPRTLTHNRQR